MFHKIAPIVPADKQSRWVGCVTLMRKEGRSENSKVEASASGGAGHRRIERDTCNPVPGRYVKGLLEVMYAGAQAGDAGADEDGRGGRRGVWHLGMVLICQDQVVRLRFSRECVRRNG